MNREELPPTVKNIKKSSQALEGFTETYYIASGSIPTDENRFLELCKPQVISFLQNHPNIRTQISMKCALMNPTSIVENAEDYTTRSFGKDQYTILRGTDLDDVYTTVCDKIKEELSAFISGGSGWRLVRVIKLNISTTKYRPLSGSSYIKLPDKITHTKAVINLKNEDNQCFKWSITRALNPTNSHPERISKALIKQSEALCWNGLIFPVTLDKIIIFEKNNPSIAVNVFGYESGLVVPLRISDYTDRATIVDLFLFESNGIKHYCTINDMERLIYSQFPKNHKNFYCYRCISRFASKQSLLDHVHYCKHRKPQRIIAATERDKILEFRNYSKSMRAPFVIYADFESTIKPIDNPDPKNPNESYTIKKQQHVPNSFCFYTKCFDDNVYSQDPKVYVANTDNDDVAAIFVKELEEEVLRIYNTTLSKIAPMIFTDEDAEIYNTSTNCHICGEVVSELDRVRDHCHITGKFRGAAHSKCNLNYKTPKFIPVIFHNLSGYDIHLFVKKLGGNLKPIPNTDEKYIALSKFIDVGNNTTIEIRFLDSFKFMASSLDTLVKNNKDSLKILPKYYSGEQLELLKRKGIYPYEYIDTVSKFDETSLPPIEMFSSSINRSNISEVDYKHAQNVWETFNMKSFKDYHKLYNETDVLLLADVFENFRDIFISTYKLDPAQYYTLPGFAWDACLKTTGIKLELLTDIGMVDLIREGTRGGISSIMHRLANANNKYMGVDYNPDVESSYIEYLDANNLYGHAMNRPLPTDGFRWMKPGELDNWRIHPCILEVDLEYPVDLHDEHNDYPLAPERLIINKVEKLVPNLNDKHRYIAHYKNLVLYTQLGLKITKIHRGITFNESPWMAQYIKLNTDLRTSAKSDFEKDLYKLMNNAVFGKTMENIEKRIDIRLVTDPNKATKLASKINYSKCKIFDENLVAIHMNKLSIKYDKPIYLGMCILELSKEHMYDFHYNYIKPLYGERAQLLFTDTDSLCYHIKTEDFFKDIAKDVTSRFDTSEYSKEHPATRVGFEVGLNKKIIGMFKDECKGKTIKEFVGLRSKSYSYELYESSEDLAAADLKKNVKKGKGVKKDVVKNDIVHQDYKNCLITRIKLMRKMNVIRSEKHEIYSEEINKCALSADDDKRIIREDGVSTYAIGHYATR